MSDFLKTCVDKYSYDKNPRLPFDGEDSGKQEYDGYTFAPFVELKLTINGELLTVGNNSRPNQENTAAIQSMQYGASDGMGVTIEIVDEQGGNFTKSFEALNKGLGDVTKDIQGFELDFGWIVTKDYGENIDKKAAICKKLSLKEINGTGIFLLPLKMNVVYEKGIVKYTIEAKDMMSRVAETRQECNLGQDDHKITLKEAIRTLARTGQSPRFDVEFLKSDYETEWDFNKSGDAEKKGEGPLSSWPTCQQNKLEAIRRWIKDYRTSDDKGIVFQYMTRNDFALQTGRVPKEPAVLVLLEDPSPSKCQKFIDFSQNNIGTYIINGGNKSPVISFNPSVNWNFTSFASNGGSATPGSGDAAKQDGKSKCPGEDEKKIDNAGAMTAGVPAPHSYGEDKAAEETVRSEVVHQKANAFREFLSPIEAELKIIGDPRYVFPAMFMGKGVSLIVINPYHLRSNNQIGCCDWLAEPVCNPIFSNKNWMILGVDHQISSGSYVTTLKLKLPMPNFDLSSDAPIGGQDGAEYIEINVEPKKCAGEQK